ncbi:MAG: AI-2E family transporter [Marinilabiliales bacterium]|nr:AI-2E family transporter [Marinilabiliales bacterium]
MQNVASFVFQLFVMMFGLFYFLRDGDRIVGLIRKLLPFEPARRDRMITQTHELVVATVGSTFSVAITQGALTGLALGFLGFQSPVFWGVTTSFFSLLPVVGSGIVWGPAAHLSLRHGTHAQGHHPRRLRHRRDRDGRQRPAAPPPERADDDARAAGVHQPPWRHGRLRVHRAR